MSEPLRYKAAVADFVDGQYIIKAVTGEKIIIDLGPAQVVSSKRGFDRYMAEYEVAECKANG